MRFYVFLLGRPGCGKSEVWRNLKEFFEKENIAHSFSRVDDFPILNSWKEEDFKRNIFTHFKPTPDGGFKVIDEDVWDELLRRLNEKIKKIDVDILAIEFARKNYTTSLKIFSPEVISKSIIVYIDAPFEVCWKRNMERVKRMREHGIDAHFVSKKEMKETYLYDDKEDLIEEFKDRIVVIKNDKETTKEDLKREVYKIVKKVKEFL